MSIRSAVNHRLESRVREIRLHGSEGGAPGNRSFLPLSETRFGNPAFYAGRRHQIVLVGLSLTREIHR